MMKTMQEQNVKSQFAIIFLQTILLFVQEKVFVLVQTTVVANLDISQRSATLQCHVEKLTLKILEFVPIMVNALHKTSVNVTLDMMEGLAAIQYALEHLPIAMTSVLDMETVLLLMCASVKKATEILTVVLQECALGMCLTLKMCALEMVYALMTTSVIAS